MSDLNWCTYCDNAINITSNALYCSEKCLKLDALHHHPSLGYGFPEFQHFLKSDINNTQQQNNETSRNTILYQSTVGNQKLKSNTLLTLIIQSSKHNLDTTNNYKVPLFYYKNTNI